MVACRGLTSQVDWTSFTKPSNESEPDTGTEREPAALAADLTRFGDLAVRGVGDSLSLAVSVSGTLCFGSIGDRHLVHLSASVSAGSSI